MQLIVPHSRTATSQRLSVAGPATWNGLPATQGLPLVSAFLLLALRPGMGFLSLFAKYLLGAVHKVRHVTPCHTSRDPQKYVTHLKPPDF